MLSVLGRSLAVISAIFAAGCTGGGSIGPPAGESSANTAAVAIAATDKSAAPEVPLRPSERHITQFYSQTVTVYDKPYGKPVKDIPEKEFPRRIVAGESRGVPVYSEKPGYVEVPMPDGRTGWIAVNAVKMSAVACAKISKTTPVRSGSGSSSDDCLP